MGDSGIELVLHVEQGTGVVTMNQLAAITLTGIGEGMLPQVAMDFAVMEWGHHPEWDWVVERSWEAWGGTPGGLDEAMLMLAKYIAGQEGPS